MGFTAIQGSEAQYLKAVLVFGDSVNEIVDISFMRAFPVRGCSGFSIPEIRNWKSFEKAQSSCNSLLNTFLAAVTPRK